MPSTVHPKTGYRYTIVTTPYQSFEDLFKSYSMASSHLPWLETLSQEAWAAKAPDLLGRPADQERRWIVRPGFSK